MSPIEFLKKELNKLALQFPSVKIKYAYNSQSDSHIVELTPQSEYYHNTELDNAWVPISLKFKELFKSEDIIFISSDSILKIDQPELQWNAEVDLFDLSYYNNFISELSEMAYLKYEFPSAFDPIMAMPLSALVTNIYHTQVSILTEERNSWITFKEATRPYSDKSQVDILEDDEFSLAA